MKKIALVAQKGGVGKTTIAVNLAVAAQGEGIQTALFDLDQQESAVIWSDRRASQQPHVEFLTERRLAEALRAAEAQGFGLAIIDTPPAAGPQAYTAAQAADLVFDPVPPQPGRSRRHQTDSAARRSLAGIAGLRRVQCGGPRRDDVA